jgi:hypothetical protein
VARWLKTCPPFETNPVKTTVVDLQYKAISKGNAVTLVYSGLRNGSCSLDDRPQRTERLRRFVPVLVFQEMGVNGFSHVAQTHKPAQKYPLNLQKGLKKILSSGYRGLSPRGMKVTTQLHLVPRLRVAILPLPVTSLWRDA